MKESYQTITKDSQGWEAVRKGFAEATHGRYLPPKAILACHSPEALQEALSFVQKEGASFCLRSGGHNYEGQSSNAPGGYIIDTAGIKTRKWLGLQKFRLGVGLTQVEMVRYLQKFGQAIPYATGGTVGLGGLVLGGGAGLASRTWGSVAHHVTRLHCVLADGSMRWFNGDTPEGKAIMSAGGGSIVALAEVEVQTHWKPFLPIFFATWNAADALKVLLALDGDGPDSDSRLGFVLRIGTDGTVALFGQCNAGGYGTARKLLKKLLKSAPIPTMSKVVWLPHFLASNQFFRVNKQQPNGWHAMVGNQLFKSSSAITTQRITPEIAEQLYAIVLSHPKLKTTPEEVSMVQLLIGGGAMWKADHQHIPYHDSRVLYQLDGYWIDPTDKEAVLEWVASLRKAMAPISVGSYVNYIDDSIPPHERSHRYYGEAYDQIMIIKKQLDPQNFFTHSHSPKP